MLASIFGELGEPGSPIKGMGHSFGILNNFILQHIFKKREWGSNQNKRYFLVTPLFYAAVKAKECNKCFCSGYGKRNGLKMIQHNLMLGKSNNEYGMDLGMFTKSVFLSVILHK